ncbi:hypothetical protein PP939_gp251 [Rhizobium phage RL38J1]|uniref:Uncharacterized protein n=1 Tax=Rhizobium phage RL38J1 TaxID=2663232 RepID=A0A6B9J1B0_9CAUD|nr:hypothetical protein PP939_gp251 [Rhizobium phage RL38J1]QGZ14089.1 hypothetical protein RL38J1_251 [Rhizobium phage RL38J1]
MNCKNADYRKLNDGSHSSSTYHKKDGTPVRQILKEELRKEVTQETGGDISVSDI